MPTPVTPTTELEAVNTMLAAISESPVSTLDDDTVVDAAMARDTLRNEMRGLQSEGWQWNTDYEYVLTPNANNEIEIPATAAFIDPSASEGKDYVWRGTRLYDRAGKTYTITKSVKVDIIWMLGFDEMPEPFRRYCYIKAIRKFVDEQMGDQALHQFTEMDEAKAAAAFRRMENKTANFNILRDSYSTARILMRRPAWRG
ncbi:hypothetical protein [Hyphomicrobium sp. ghe19]|uniref:hypothetical protein n=1 Tax=Hyphomicrobium sp. ghe19 TaxID=2682968 RepID=UPI0013679933|nr:hypothetical protein HYPP_02628 [Hyphomicrobium sp. ghe19]